MAAPASPAAAQAAGEPADAAQSPCDLRPPQPLLVPRSYARQTLVRKANNELSETADLGNGVRLQLLQSACVDIASTEIIFLVPDSGAQSASRARSIAFARKTLPQLKTSLGKEALSALDDFLKRSSALPSEHGVRAECNDGSTADPGECSWDSTGGYVLSIKHIGKNTRIAVIKYVSV